MHVIFLHGMESGPDGFKIRVLSEVARELGAQVTAPDFRFSRDPQQRLAHLREVIAGLTGGPLLLVGSSLGGYVAALAAADIPDRVDGLFLLCPAFDLPGYPLTRPEQPLRGDAVHIVHGRHDEVVPLANSLRASAAWACPLSVLEGDHGLHAVVDEIAAILRIFLARVCKISDRTVNL